MASKRLDDVFVGLSISDSPDLRQFGLSETHLRHAFVELSRQLLAAGAGLAYAGDLREHGFTDVLIDLLHTYSNEGRPARERLRLYLPASLWNGLLADRRAKLRLVGTPVIVEDPDQPLPDLTREAADRVRRANLLTSIRKRMTAEIDVRIVLGGRVVGFEGRYPGVAEETALAVQAGRSVFILGGFGGCARQLADLVREPSPDTLSRLPEMADDFVVDTLREAGVVNLRNGLDTVENEVLFESPEIDAIVSLVLRGMYATLGQDRTITG